MLHAPLAGLLTSVWVELSATVKAADSMYARMNSAATCGTMALPAPRRRPTLAGTPSAKEQQPPQPLPLPPVPPPPHSQRPASDAKGAKAGSRAGTNGAMPMNLCLNPWKKYGLRVLILRGFYGIHQEEMPVASLPCDGLPKPNGVLQLPRFAADTLWQASGAASGSCVHKPASLVEGCQTRHPDGAVKRRCSI
jgi:hypothetical protein